VNWRHGTEALCFAVWKVVFKYPLGLYEAGRNFAVQLVSLIRRGEGTNRQQPSSLLPQLISAGIE